MNRTTTLTILLGLTTALGGACSTEKKQPPREPTRGPAQQQQEPAAPPDTAQVTPPMIPVDEMPKLVHSPSVLYPEEAKAKGEQGTVYVKALVGKDGSVTEAMVDPEKPVSSLLAKAAVDAVKQWKFTPATFKGMPVAVWIVVPVSFRLK